MWFDTRTLYAVETGSISNEKRENKAMAIITSPFIPLT